jgi:hypothetical protein
MQMRYAIKYDNFYVLLSLSNFGCDCNTWISETVHVFLQALWRLAYENKAYTLEMF